MVCSVLEVPSPQLILPPSAGLGLLASFTGSWTVPLQPGLVVSYAKMVCEGFVFGPPAQVPCFGSVSDSVINIAMESTTLLRPSMQYDEASPVAYVKRTFGLDVKIAWFAGGPLESNVLPGVNSGYVFSKLRLLCKAVLRLPKSDFTSDSATLVRQLP